MKTKKNRRPKYRRQRRTGRKDLAFVELGGSRFYLGDYGTKESRQEYRRLLAEWEGGGRAVPVAQDEIRVVEVTVRFLDHAEGYYRRPDGTPTSELSLFKMAVQALIDTHGHIAAREFGPRALKAVRASLVKKKLARTTINSTVRRIRAIFKWGAAEEIVDASVYHALQTVSGLSRGRSGARETAPVGPVPIAHVNAIKPHVSRQIWGLVELQGLTGARSGELLGLRAVDIDTSGEIWTYSPPTHKTTHRGHARTIYFGPSAQKVLKPFMTDRPLNVPLFSPREAVAEWLKKKHAKRGTPLSCGNTPGSNRKPSPMIRPGEVYTPSSYGRAIARACKRAGVPHWHPHQLRHARATEIRREFGLEAARVILGHRSPAVTALYAEVDLARAREIMREIG